MIPARYTSFFLFFLPFLALLSPTFALPPYNAAVAKRDNAQIKEILDTLKGRTDVAVAGINDLVNTQTVTDEAAAPFIIDLTDAFNAAKDELATVSASETTKRQDGRRYRQTRG